MNSPIKFQSIDHITLIVENLERTRHFYCDCLGMQQVTRPDFNFPGLWLSPSSPTAAETNYLQAMIHITLADEQSGLAGWGDRQVRRPSRGHHFAFEVADAQSAHEHLQQLGIPIVVAPKQRPDGAIQCYVQDPDGHLIELFSKPNNSGSDIL